MSQTDSIEKTSVSPPPDVDTSTLGVSSPAPIPASTELRSHTCGQLRASHVGEQVRLHGWAHAVRDRGGVLFVLLRDRYGVVQVTIGDQSPKEAVETGKNIRLEYVVGVEGTVTRRDAAVVNLEMKTGEIEIVATDVKIVSRTKPMPFMIAEQGKGKKADTKKGNQKNSTKTEIAATGGASDDTRLKYRYLDLRKPTLQENLLLRHRATMATRNFLDASGFIEVETPILTKATPEGARDYLVPSRVHPGSWYALPQSPQIYKQLLMVSGFDRYFQITRCFRDEDLRQDRQPEFTQIDLEMSFVERESVLEVAEGIVKCMFAKVLGKQIGEIPRIPYKEAMDRFGVDAPDMRFGMELKDITDAPIIKDSDFSPIKKALDDKGMVKAMVITGAAKASSRKVLDGYTAFVKSYGLSGLLYAKVGNDNTLNGPLSKVTGDKTGFEDFVASALNARLGDVILVACGTPAAVNAGLGRLRVKLGQENGLTATGPEYAFCWVVDFPLFEFDEGAGRYVSVHHPFTSPLPSQMNLLEDESRIGDIMSDAYDLVCNGSEIGGGSIRIHNPEVQQNIFKVLGISEAEQTEKFGFLLDALSFGAPPHGGLALGLERCIMIMAKADSIRDVVAFPKTTSASDLMAGAPAPVSSEQLEELSVESTAQEEKGE
ncbi:aspartyl-tRNA synthetase [Chondrus crispus]|uniref:Aspartyl-tRNA synthetase n=1 Tax=Chondrus crispus TaxID=2769 RepID=R7QPH9_CHOCR|nr:aspartyl-tRNA synthetase [Chondrus crispus]CDF39683.1 aspartyl-tRNA synthetase [Chondrus crispus]|eukprot:XP_005709977.1 aspartyl-tRNA synthetase [Chondrus crispus]